MKFLATLGSHYTGAQGASLVFGQKRGQLPKGYWYGSFDEKDRLWEDAEQRHRVPVVRVHDGGGFSFGLGCFEEPWSDDFAFFSFCDEPAPAGE